MKLWDLFDMDLYRKMVIERYVRVNKKDQFRVLNYTEKAQFEGMWNPVTKQCRGLVIDYKFNILARPFDKFMNYGQGPFDDKLMDYAVQVTDKLDGSLGILFRTDKRFLNDDKYQGITTAGILHPQYSIVTRGSFDSDQAIKAIEILNDQYYYVRFDDNWTYMFEIVYPGNRIVLDYGDTEDLILLGARHIETGLVRAPEDVKEWPGTKAQSFPYATLSEALAAPPRANAEGYVVYFPDLDYRLKIKQEDYIQLHKIVTGLTTRKVWENLKAGKTLEDLINIIPDEWHSWLKSTVETLDAAFAKEWSEIHGHFYRIGSMLGSDYSRKDFAAIALATPYSGILFALLDGKDVWESVWDLVRPAAD